MEESTNKIVSNLGYLGDAFQLKVISELLTANNINLKTNDNFFYEVIDLIKPQYFEKQTYRHIMSLIKSYYDRYKKQGNMDNIKQLFSTEGVNDIEAEKLSEILLHIHNNIWKKYKSGEIENDRQFIKDTLLDFIRQQELVDVENVINVTRNKGKVTDADITKLSERLRNISFIGKAKNYGTTLYENMDDVLKEDYRDPIGTGIKGLDEKINGSIGKGELCLFLAAQGVGKTTILSYVANEAYLKGYNVLHVILEGTAKEVKRKHYCKLTQIKNEDLSKKENIPLVKEILKGYEDDVKTGNLVVERFPDDTTPLGLEKWIKDTEDKKGYRFNLLVIDYLDELKNDNGIKDKYQAEEDVVKGVESLATRLNIPIYSAVQAKKEGNNVRILDMVHCGGAVAKLKKAHLIISIGRDMEQMNTGKANFAVIKCRFAKSGWVWEDCTFDNDLLNIKINDTSVSMKTFLNEDEAQKVQIKEAIAKKQGYNNNGTGNSGYSTEKPPVNNYKRKNELVKMDI